MTAKRRLRSRADPRQATLGLGSAERYKLFFAAMPPASVAVQALELAQRLRFGISSEPRIPHVTLYGLGDYDGIPHEVIGAVTQAAGSVRARAFDAVFDGVQAFNGPRRPLVLRCGKGLHGFVALQNAIGNALAGAGADRHLFDSSFTPHLTLFYGGGDVPEQALDEPIAWRVQEFSLILSLQGRKHYEPYGQWKLHG
ncbi:MAG: 2'-5' RNA ligase family protein [Reyranellaceae bacterium]